MKPAVAVDTNVAVAADQTAGAGSVSLAGAAHANQRRRDHGASDACVQRGLGSVPLGGFFQEPGRDQQGDRAAGLGLQLVQAAPTRRPRDLGPDRRRAAGGPTSYSKHAGV